MADLKLLALDAEDLAVISAHLQDAVLQVADIVYQRSERRFVAMANRFDWEAAVGAAGSKPSCERRRAALRFERVLDAKLQGIDLKAKRQVLSLLAVQFQEKDAPSGFVTLVFAGGGAIRLEVECIEAELRDLGAAWAARRQPEHPDKGFSPAG
jgi:hypothetical protein